MITRIGIVLIAGVLSGGRLAGQEPDAANRIIGRIVAGEQEFLNRLRELHPMIETYIQELSTDPKAAPTPVRDHYMLGRFDLTKGVATSNIASSAGFRKRPALWFGKPGDVVFNAAGWAQMTIPDAQQFNQQTYRFDFVERVFLGEVRCLVFDLAPHDAKAAGRFIGRIWVEDRDYRIVRFNGTYTHSKSSRLYFHFDSWRVNVEPGFWAPAVVYVEEADPEGKALDRPRFKAQTRLWGYQPARGGRLDELANLSVESAAPIKDEAEARDASPVESQRSWERLAEDNVIDWLQKNSLAAPRGEVERVLETVVNNLIVTNGLNLDVRCRVLLTTPLESFSAGQTIVVSRGFLDVLPDEASLAMVLAGELAHLALGHRTRTSYAFGDQTMLTVEEALDKLRFTRTPEEMEAASRKTLEILSKSPYQERLATVGLFLKVLGGRTEALSQLARPNLGNQFASLSNLLSLVDLTSRAPELDENKLEQIAALPLGSRIRLDPWTNRIALIKTGPLNLVSAREKMPLEVTPVSLYLTRVEQRAAMGTAPAGGTAAGSNGNSQ